MAAPATAAPRISSLDAASLVRRSLRYVAPFRGPFLVKLGFGLASVLPMLLLPWPAKILVDRVVDDIPFDAFPTPLPVFVRPLVAPLEDLSTTQITLWVVGFQALLLILVGAIGTSSREADQADAYLSSGHDTATRTENEANAGFSLAGGLLGYFDFRWTIRLTQALNHHYRSRLFERIQSLPMSAFDDERIGDAVYRVMYDTPSITNGSFRIILTPILATILILLAIGILSVVFGDHPLIIGSALAMLPLSLFATLPFAGAARRRSEDSRSAGATTTATVEEGMSNILAVQSLGGRDRELDRFDRDSWDSFSEFRRLVRVVLLSSVFLLVPFFWLTARAVLYSIDMVIEGQISRGDFLLFIGYFFLIAGASVEIGALWFRIQGSAAGLHRVFFLMDLPAEEDPPDARTIEGVREGIRFENVSFAFDDGTPAVRDVSFEAPVGRVTALVGPAGAGKTTLAYLLCGFHTPQEGRILVDGVDARGIAHDSLREQIAFVFQETALFDDTVLANIRIGRPDAPLDAVRRAARTAGADEFIENLPGGYETRLGRAGGKLSVGQKQRLAIARALVRESPVLVLDEPTSALDPQTERRLVEALREASRDRLVFVIAHRLSTVRAADEILFVESGQIAERGTHEELVERPGGAYRRFVDLQTRGGD